MGRNGNYSNESFESKPMKIIDALYSIKQLNHKIIQTKDVATYLGISTTYASKLLARLADAGHLIHLSRSLWAIADHIDPLMLPEYLTAPFPCYISLQTALYYHDMISQIPDVIYAVSLARTRRYQTPLATLSIHHVQPYFFFDFAVENAIKMAIPEKALIDILYLSPAKSQLFKSLPEISLPKKFKIKKAQEIIEKIESVQRRNSVKKKFEALLASI